MPSTRVELRPLSIHLEEDEYIVGRVETGEFVSLPPLGYRIISLLGSGQTVEAIQRTLVAEVGAEVDVKDFIISFIELGFVSRLDGNQIQDNLSQRYHLSGVKPAYVSWMFSRVAILCYVLAICAGTLTLLSNPSLFPKYQDFFWSPAVGVVLLVNMAIFFGISISHELAHFFAARSLNLPVRFDIGTRLDNFALVTQVPSLWSVTKSSRYRVYLAGMVWQLVLASVLLILVALRLPNSMFVGISKYVILEIFLASVLQAGFFTRTDLYLVLMNWSGCKNLFDDSIRLLKHHFERLRLFVLREGGVSALPDPLEFVPPAERRKVRWYSWVVLVGSIAALSISIFYGLPVTVNVYQNATVSLRDGLSTTNSIDIFNGIVGLAVPTVFGVLFVAAFVHSHHAGISKVLRHFETRSLSTPAEFER